MNENLEYLEKAIFENNDCNEINVLNSVDYSEMLDNPAFDVVPIVKNIISIVKASKKIMDNHLYKNVCAFLSEVQKGVVNKENYSKRKRYFESNPQNVEKELGCILIYLEKNVEIIRSRIMGCIYSALLNELISYDEFAEMMDITSRIFICDIELFIKVYSSSDSTCIDETSYKTDRLRSLGLIDYTIKTVFTNRTDYYLYKNELGTKYYKFAITKIV